MDAMTSKTRSAISAKHVQDANFAAVLDIIRKGRTKGFQAVNVVLIETYWAVGEYLSTHTATAGWGKGTVKELADWLSTIVTELKGFSASNLWRMKQFYEMYAHSPELATLLRELSWSKHLLLMSQCKSDEEKEFYLIASTRGHWSHRELQRQLDAGTFERTVLSDQKLATVLRVLPPEADGVFKDTYVLDFLNLPDRHSEADLQSAMLRNLRKFLMELGDGFAFVGEKVRVQVGKEDFELDLLLFHRDLQCLVAFELKTGHFEPSHLGQLSFYLEALDRQRKREHENPSIGVLLCRSKDEEVVEFAMSRTLSPALVAKYETQLIPKTLLREKLREWAATLTVDETKHGTRRTR
jgi:predicted nuclease of restriction endonuclease-like (RecB) superfamily